MPLSARSVRPCNAPRAWFIGRKSWDDRSVAIALNGEDAQQLVVEPGDRVRAAGRFVHLDGADWLDLAQISDLVGRSGPWRSNRSVRLVGADAAAIPVGGRMGDPSVMPGRVRVVGVWRDDTISVETQSPLPSPAARVREPLFTLPPPVGGWNVEEQSMDIQGREELRAAGAILRDGWLRDDSGALLLRVAAADVDAVERVLAEQLPRRLYVVQSRYTAGQLREVEDMFAAHANEWGFEAWSSKGMDPQCQPYADVILTRVNRQLAAWADTLPAGLLTLHPAMTPA